MAYFDISGPRFSDLIIAPYRLERLSTDARSADDRDLPASDIPNTRMLRWEKETEQVNLFRCPSNRVHRSELDSGETRVRADDFDKPHHVRAVDVTAGGMDWCTPDGELIGKIVPEPVAAIASAIRGTTGSSSPRVVPSMRCS